MSKMDKNWKNKALREIDFDDEPLVEGAVRIPVAEVVLGQRIVTAWKRSHRFGFEVLVPLNDSLVTKREPCEGNNGMHVHINKSNCFDSRAYVYVTR